jgi:predicted Zn-dependent peptidase
VPTASLTNQVALLAFPDAPTWYLRAYVRGPQLASPDLAPFAVGMEILSQRLYNVVREENALAYTVGAAVALGQEAPGTLWLTTTTPVDALALVKQEIEHALAAPPALESLATAKAQLRTATLANSVNSADLAHQLTKYQVLTGDRKNADAWLTNLEAVTDAQVLDVLTRTLRNAAITAAGPDDALSAEDLSDLVPEG